MAQIAQCVILELSSVHRLGAQLLSFIQVGQAVIQLAKNAALKTINFVRSRWVFMSVLDLDHTNDAFRDDIDALRQELQGLGATHVLTYDELDDRKAIKAKVKEWTNGQVYTPFK